MSCSTKLDIYVFISLTYLMKVIPETCRSHTKLDIYVFISLTYLMKVIPETCHAPLN